MPDVVLVHGTTQTAAGFDGVVEALRRSGHRARAVSVPGAGARTAGEYARILAAQVPETFDRPVVAAHSASGLLLPALAEELDSRRQVWIAAVVPDHAGRRSLMEEVRADPPSVFNPDWIGVDPASDPALAARFLFHDAGPDALRRALGTVALCDLSSVLAAPSEHDPARRPSTYLLPLGDRALQVSWMRRAARERLGVEPVEVEGGHNFYAARPGRCARLILHGAEG
ncbi:alpha/beta fold hydrolase [Nocardiopsis potens]|uniref:alpha/beta fold hydrolase n=1 Tax=Nocardiopsis potens TaxID=1246458 RepID=UPI0003474FBB|nr:alpha/beta hydrolase [Nocardiopsis potens]